MAKKPKGFDPKQKKDLEAHATKLISAFVAGVVQVDDPNALVFGEYGGGIFEGLIVHFSKEYFEATQAFTLLAVSMLHSKHAHEKTIRSMCQKAGQQFVEHQFEKPDPTAQDLKNASEQLVAQVLAEAGKEYIHICPNHLLRLPDSSTLVLGRVSCMPTAQATATTKLASIAKIHLMENAETVMDFAEGKCFVGMPSTVWVVEVAATKANVMEEARWLIDVAVSLARLSTAKWSGLFPGKGDTEPSATTAAQSQLPQVTLDGANALTGAVAPLRRYELSIDVLNDLGHATVQAVASKIFDPPPKSLAESVAQGLGWMTRARCATDRAEKLLHFFTAMEALLSSDDKTAPVVQNICRHASVIYSQIPKDRAIVFAQIKNLYARRSSLIHAGRREVLEGDVALIQIYVESIYFIVLNNCDLKMNKNTFIATLSQASHGLPWSLHS